MIVSNTGASKAYHPPRSEKFAGAAASSAPSAARASDDEAARSGASSDSADASGLLDPRAGYCSWKFDDGDVSVRGMSDD